MSLSNKQILTSGCGLSWSGQTKKTWINILKAIGSNISDVGAPAVSNQWILDRAIDHLLHTTTITHAVIQLTNLGKLDIEVDQERLIELVEPDSLRNFTIQGVWPSSVSEEHLSKQLWKKWLYSPGLELLGICGKLVLLHHWCRSHHIELVVFQGYRLPWTGHQRSQLYDIVDFDSEPAVSAYKNSEQYQWHDHANTNTVPCVEFQFELAQKVAAKVDPTLLPRLAALRQQYLLKHYAA